MSRPPPRPTLLPLRRTRPRSGMSVLACFGRPLTVAWSLMPAKLTCKLDLSPPLPRVDVHPFVLVEQAEGGEAPAPKPKKKAAPAPDAAGAPAKKDAKAAKGPVNRAESEAKAKKAFDNIKAEKQRIADEKAKLKALEKEEKDLEKAAEAAKKEACEGQFICLKAITGF